MERLVEKILEYKDALEEREEVTDTYVVSREEFTFLLSGISSFRRVPGISEHMGFEELYHCEREEDKALVKEHLKKLFDIEDRDSLLKACYTRCSACQEYEHFMTFWKNAPIFELSELNPEAVQIFTGCMEIATNFYPLLQEKGFYAWDINERIGLCRTAVACGIISDEEFFEITDDWVCQAQVFYHSFEEYAISCLCGAIYQMAAYGETIEELEQFLDLNIRMMDLLLYEEGPWQINEWYEPEEREWAELVDNNLGCFVTKRALEKGHIGYMYHDEPYPEQPDSGWRFMYGNESQEYLDDAENTSIVRINTICNLQPDILAYIHAKIGTEFEMGEDGWEEIER